MRPSSGAASQDVRQVLEMLSNRTLVRPNQNNTGAARPCRGRMLTRIFRAGSPKRRIPKGFRPPVPQSRDCEQRATLGKGEGGIGNPKGVVALGHDEYRRNPVGVVKVCTILSQGSSSLATLGFVAESLWDSSASGARIERSV